MVGDFFVWALAGATAAVAIALLAVLFRRPQRPQLVPREPVREARGSEADDDDAAMENEEIGPTWGDPRGEDDPDLAKICPSCGQRYGLESRICERDNSELAALN